MAKIYTIEELEESSVDLLKVGQTVKIVEKSGYRNPFLLGSRITVVRREKNGDYMFKNKSTKDYLFTETKVRVDD